MKILDYKLVSKHFKTDSPTRLFIDRTVENNYKEFENLVKEHIDLGYTPLGGVSITYHEPDHILTQSLVLYED